MNTQWDPDYIYIKLNQPTNQPKNNTNIHLVGAPFQVHKGWD